MPFVPRLLVVVTEAAVSDGFPLGVATEDADSAERGRRELKTPN